MESPRPPATRAAARLPAKIFFMTGVNSTPRQKLRGLPQIFFRSVPRRVNRTLYPTNRHTDVSRRGGRERRGERSASPPDARVFSITRVRLRRIMIQPADTGTIGVSTSPRRGTPPHRLIKASTSVVADAIGDRTGVIVVGHSLGGFTAPLFSSPTVHGATDPRPVGHRAGRGRCRTDPIRGRHHELTCRPMRETAP